MTDHTRDTLRALAAVKSVVDKRSIVLDHSEIMVTLEHTVTAVLLVLMDHDPRNAAIRLNAAHELIGTYVTGAASTPAPMAPKGGAE